jgi:hypothetical protein
LVNAATCRIGRQPARCLPEKGRTFSTLAVQITRVSPHSISTEPSAWRVTARWQLSQLVEVRPLGA